MNEQEFKDETAISILCGIIASGKGGDKAEKCKAAYEYASCLWFEREIKVCEHALLSPIDKELIESFKELTEAAAESWPNRVCVLEAQRVLAKYYE